MRRVVRVEGEVLALVTAPHFAAGIMCSRTAKGWVIHDAAPILRWAIGWGVRDFVCYARARGWTMERCPDLAARGYRWTRTACLPPEEP